MAAPDALDIHDVNVSEQVIFTPQGETARHTIVKFQIGSHGPFTLTFDPGQATADRVRAGIESQQADLRRILELEQNKV